MASGIDRERFQSLIDEHLPALYRLAVRTAQNENDAEDLVQEAVLKAFRSFHQFQTGTNFRAWIFRILVNTYINKYRRKKLEPVAMDFAEIDPAEQATGSRAFRADQIRDLQEQLSDEVKVALESMQEDYRMVFLLSVIEDFSYKEIAEIVGIPAGTVMSRLFRARKYMRDELENFAEKNGLIRESTVPEKS